MSCRVSCLHVVACLMLACAGAFAGTLQEDYDKVAELYGARGRPDAAVAAARALAERAKSEGDKAMLARTQLLLSQIYTDLGQDQDAVNIALEAAGSAAGTPLEAQAEAEFGLRMAAPLLRRHGYVGSLGYLESAQASTARVTEPQLRRNLESRLWTAKAYSYRNAAQDLARLGDGVTAAQLPRPVQTYLAAALGDIAPSKLPAGEGSLPQVMLGWLDAQRPWPAALLRRALAANTQVIELDRRLAGKLGETNLAADYSQRGDLLDMLGDAEGAITQKERAREIFNRNNVFRDEVLVLGSLRDLYLRQGRIEQAFGAENTLIQRVETQALALSGQTMAPFIAQFRNDYERGYAMLYVARQQMLGIGDAQADEILRKMVIQADRLNFRPVRRDLALYREVGAGIPARRQQLAQRAEAMASAQAARDKAAQDEGRDPKSYSPLEGVVVNSPFVALEDAKRNLVAVLEDAKRASLEKEGQVVPMPRSIDEVRRGMTADDAIVMYIRQAVRARPLAAVIIGAQGPLRFVELPLQEIDTLTALVKQSRQEITAQLPGLDATLARLSQMLWKPLGALPAHLTVVLVPELIGLPLEALPLADGRPLIAAHTLRYAFGLAHGLGAARARAPFRNALVAGVAQFGTQPLAPLPYAGVEVDALGARLKASGVALALSGTRPAAGAAIFAQARQVDIVHIATHSVLDSSDVAQVDALAFPRDRVFAYELGLSPLRSRLVFLSACELFAPRRDRVNPVSGITTSALSVIAPDVVSSLWRLADSPATALFVLRFYDALLAEGDAATALAVSKRDFIEPQRLRQWFASAGIDVPALAPGDGFSRPYFWAPFVLTVGLP